MLSSPTLCSGLRSLANGSPTARSESLWVLISFVTEHYMLNDRLLLLSGQCLSPANKPYTTHRLLFGTHTSGQAQDYLQIATVHLPKRDEVALDREDYDDERGGMF